MSENRAPEGKLNVLHDLVATTLLDDIQRYRNNGEPVPPQLLNQAIKFLKDNGIDAPGRLNKSVARLEQELLNLTIDHEVTVN